MHPDFAVIDTETTGLSPDNGDRIVEIAIVRVDCFGDVTEEYSSLVNPQRSVGPTFIHKIMAKDVRNAPTFKQLVGDIISRIKDTVIVGHNVSFDRRFLCAELDRADARIPEIAYLCTRTVASLLASDLPSRRLHGCCDHFGITLSDAHSALGDARATAAILSMAIKQFGVERVSDFCRPRLHEITCRSANDWPISERQNLSYSRSEADNLNFEKKHWIEESVDEWVGGENGY